MKKIKWENKALRPTVVNKKNKKIYYRPVEIRVVIIDKKRDEGMSIGLYDNF